MQKIFRLFALIAFALALGMYSTPTATAQEKSAAGKTTVTGCLQKGDEAGEYSITGEDFERNRMLVYYFSALASKRSTGSLAWRWVPIIMCPSRSARVSSLHGFGQSSVGQKQRLSSGSGPRSL